jgi:phosphatidylglycerol:prolipoprotein diacylglycerol transferase
MLVHPQFDPIAFQIGPVAVRWYGLMYLVAFVLVVVLGKIRARRNLLTGWHPRDVDDMLFYGVFGVILGGGWATCLFYKPLYYLAASARNRPGLGRRHEFSRRFPRRAARALVLRAQSPQALARRHRFRRTARAAGSRGGPPRQFHQRRAGGPGDRCSVGDGVSRRSTSLPRHPSQLYQLALEGLLLFVLLWWYSSRPRPTGAVSGMFLVGYGALRFIAEYAREPDNFLGLLAGGLSMGSGCRCR